MFNDTKQIKPMNKPRKTKLLDERLSRLRGTYSCLAVNHNWLATGRRLLKTILCFKLIRGQMHCRLYVINYKQRCTHCQMAFFQVKASQFWLDSLPTCSKEYLLHLRKNRAKLFRTFMFINTLVQFMVMELENLSNYTDLQTTLEETPDNPVTLTFDLRVNACQVPDLIRVSIRNYTTDIHTTVLRLAEFCPRQPRWAGNRRNIHPLTPIMVISHPLPASSIYYDPWHPPCLIYVPNSLFPQSLSKFSLIYLLAKHPPLHTLYISSPNHWLLFTAHAHTIATCFAVVPRLCHLILVSLSTRYLELYLVA